MSSSPAPSGTSDTGSRAIKGKEYSDANFFRRAAALAKEMGFTWGGDWKSFPDRPHLQWDAYGKYTSSMVRMGRRPPAMPLWKAAEEAEEEEMKIYHWFTEMPDWARESAEKSGAVNVYEVNLQVLCWLDRLGLLE